MASYENEIRAAYRSILCGYKQIYKQHLIGVKTGNNDDTLLDMVECLLCELDVMPIDKASRWMGFIQGLIAANEIETVQAMRNETRKIFRPIYKKFGLSANTIEVSKDD